MRSHLLPKNFHVLEPGYDVAPWDGTYENLDCDPETAQRPWDADRTTLENLPNLALYSHWTNISS